MDQPEIPDPAIRAATADREQTVDLLKAAFVAGRLTLDEFRDRVGGACAARTYGDLAAVVADLPPEPLVSPDDPVPENAMAAASMLFGCTQFLSLGLTAIPAIICGHVALRQIGRTSESGRGQAAIGLVLGYLGLFWLAIMILALTGLGLHGTG